MGRLLVVNGCSMTRGAELADPQREAWPAVLGQLLGVPVVNLACDGGSNRRIVRTAVTNLPRVCQEAGVSLRDTMLICMWTGIERSEHFRATELDPGHPDDLRPDLAYERNWFRVGTWRADQGDAPSSAYYRHLWSDPGGIVNWLLDWLLLDGFARAHGVTARYALAWDLLRKMGDPPPAARDLMSLIDPSSVYGGAVYRDDTSFHLVTALQGLAYGPEWHPLAPAHEHYARLLFDWLNPSTG